MSQLDRTGQRIVGVMIEKQFSVPDTYPLSENALLAGCNQSNNRDPVMDLRDFQVRGALLRLQEDEWVARVEGGGRVARFRHRLDDRLRVDQKALAVLAELLLRGPQAPGALKPRVARMGFHASPEEIEALLRELAARHPALVAQLPLGARERDRRWRHLLGDGSEQVPEAQPESAATPGPTATAPAIRATTPGTEDRIAALEARVEALEARLDRLLPRPDAL